MNISQAKAAAGIKYNLGARDDFSRAEKDCVKQIVQARGAGDDEKAALLSEAKALFQKRGRTQNRCLVCGVTIARGAEHCRIHSRQSTKRKLIALPVLPVIPSKTRNSNARVHDIPVGGELAEIGYFSVAVQKVVKKWSAAIGSKQLESYFVQIACPIINTQHGDDEMTVQVSFENKHHWQAIFELGTAFAGVMQWDRPERWLITMPEITIGSSDGFESWEQISQRIVRWGGPIFKPTALAKTYSRLRMNTTKAEAAACRRRIKFEAALFSRSSPLWRKSVATK